MRSTTTAVLIVLCLGWSTLALGQRLPWWVETVTVTPPGTGGIGAIRLDGVWLDTCAPDAISHTRMDNEIQLSVSVPVLNVGCGDFPTPWSLTEEFGPINGPGYTILGSLYAVDPNDRGQRQLLSGPDMLYRQVPPPRATFHGLGNPSPDGYVSRAFDVSADGKVVVGHNELEPGGAGFITEEAFAWSADTGMFPLGLLPGGIPGGSTAFGVTPEGNTVVGRSTSAAALGGYEAFRWSLGTGMVPVAGSDHVLGDAVAASRSGGVITGSGSFFAPGGGQPHAYRWTRDTGPVDLGTLAPFGDSAAADISAQGTVIAGTSAASLDPNNPFVRPGLSREPFRWTQRQGMVGLGHLPYDPADVPNAYLDTRASAVSADGHFVVGTSELVSLDGLPSFFQRAFIWNRRAGMLDLGGIAGVADVISSAAVDVSRDAELVVGNLSFDSTSDEILPFVWDAGHGIRLLEDVLRFDYGLDQTDRLDGWNLGAVAAISDNGTTIVGTGINPQGRQEAWRVVLQRMAPMGDANFDGVVDEDDVMQWESNFGLGRRGETTFWSRGDFDGNGTVDAGDYALLMSNYTGKTPLPTLVPEPHTWCLLLTCALLVAARKF